ncbi:hypothetical protein RS982_18815 [Stenotrophomonas indicatrix]|jgi:cytochrome c-type biogenesis protein CcmH/NrfF|uniref:hypothetical protein n=1 Tax=Stenotrophomonas indicatrix TaxID=2045451 RepID=UPI0028E9B825|nr:hypothetical protein [Stenotrophomonas indicatrix]MDT9583344.1 hypothetical protein [Stenotrophomonas indicatrix]
MNPATDNDGWNDLQALWQQTSSLPVMDWTALQREAERRSRWIRLRSALELLVATAALGNCIRVLLDPRKLIAHEVLWSLMALVLLVTGWVFVQRRRQCRSRGLPPAALLAFERQRARISMLIWRVNIWLSLVVWAGLVLIARSAMQAGPEAPTALSPQTWALNLWLNAAVVLMTAVAGAWAGGRRRRRLARLADLEAQLQ